MRSVVANLVTSLEFQPIRCAAMLCRFGRTRNSYVATWFILLSSTVESSATNGYVVIPEPSGQGEARAGRNVERTKKKPNSVPNSGFNRCSMKRHVNMNFTHLLNVLYFMYFIYYWCIFLLISSYRKSFWSFVHVIIYCVGAGITTLMSISYGLDQCLLLSKDGKDAVYGRRIGRRGVYFPPELAFFLCR